MWDHIINIHSSELLHTKTKESRINEHNFFFFKWTMYMFYLIILSQDFLRVKKRKEKNDY